MDIAKLKDIIRKLNFLKDYSLLMVPAVIGLVAVLLFIPTQLMSSKLKKQIVNESIQKRGKKVKSLIKNAVSRNQWKVEREYQLAFENDANQIALLAKQSTQRPLLSYKIFPEPKDTSVLLFAEFGQRYRNAVDELIARTNARDCPTEAELQKSMRSSSSRRGSKRSRRRKKLSMSRLSEVEATIMDVLCREKAKSAAVYANPADLSGYEFWEEYEYTGRNKAVTDCWYWQLAYWIIEDVVDTIDAMNAGSNSVLTSPVKRLLSVSFSSTSSNSYRKGKKTTDDNKPSYVFSIEDGLAESFTGRFTDDDIDVVHFRVAVVVSTKAVLPFMRQLCSAKQHKFRGFSGKDQEQTFKHNQITILESNTVPVDREDETHKLYRYGEDAVVELDLTCEYIFNKNGYDEIKPESVKESIKESLKKIEEK